MPKPGPDKRLCGAQRPNQPAGITCTQRAGHGTKHPGYGTCSRHGGNTPSHVKAAEEEQARELCGTLGRPIQTTAADALMREIYETAGNVEFYRGLVQALPTHPEPDVYVKDDEGGRGHWERGDPGVYGRTYHQSGVPTGEAKPHVLVNLYNEERKHLARITVDALKIGIAEQLVHIAEAQATQIAAALRGLAIALGHDPGAPEVREAFRAQLTLIAGGLAA